MGGRTAERTGSTSAVLTRAALVQVTQVKVPPFDVTTALQVGCGSKKAKRLPVVRQRFYLKNNLPFKSKLVRTYTLVATCYA